MLKWGVITNLIIKLKKSLLVMPKFLMLFSQIILLKRRLSVKTGDHSQEVDELACIFNFIIPVMILSRLWMSASLLRDDYTNRKIPLDNSLGGKLSVYLSLTHSPL